MEDAALHHCAPQKMQTTRFINGALYDSERFDVLQINTKQTSFLYALKIFFTVLSYAKKCKTIYSIT